MVASGLRPQLLQDILDHVLQQRLLQDSESREPARREAGARGQRRHRLALGFSTGFSVLYRLPRALGGFSPLPALPTP